MIFKIIFSFLYFVCLCFFFSFWGAGGGGGGYSFILLYFLLFFSLIYLIWMSVRMQKIAKSER